MWWNEKYHYYYLFFARVECFGKNPTYFNNERLHNKSLGGEYHQASVKVNIRTVNYWNNDYILIKNLYFFLILTLVRWEWQSTDNHVFIIYSFVLWNLKIITHSYIFMNLHIYIASCFYTQGAFRSILFWYRADFDIWILFVEIMLLGFYGPKVFGSLYKCQIIQNICRFISKRHETLFQFYHF